MKRFLLIIVLVIIAVGGIYWFSCRHNSANNNLPKQPPIALKKHSLAFNKSITELMNAYLDIKNAFVEADSVKAKENCTKFISLLDSIPMTELKKDTLTIYETVMSNITDIRLNAASLLQQNSLTEMRQDFRMISEILYPSFFKAINYEGGKLYWQNCSMAFGEGKEANWISNTKEINNPYLGKNHPEFKATMLHCGETKDTIKGL